MEISVWYGWCLCAQLSTKNGISIFCLPYQTGMVGAYVHGYSGYSVLVFPHINAVIHYSSIILYLLSVSIFVRMTKMHSSRVVHINRVCLFFIKLLIISWHLTKNITFQSKKRWKLDHLYKVMWNIHWYFFKLALLSDSLISLYMRTLFI